jgi:hypothetical protein
MAVTPLLSTGNLIHIAEPGKHSPNAGQPPKRHGRRQLLDKPDKFTCLHCEDNVTFSRKSDLKRHERLKHSHKNNRHFQCSAKGCFRGQAPWTFARSDKLTSHIKDTHNLDTIFSHCPINDCSFGSFPLEVLGVHIRRAHPGHGEGRAVLNATSCKVLRCPLWRCDNHFTAKTLPQHIISHNREEVDAVKPSLEQLGLLLQSIPGRDITVQVVCPICNTVSTDIENFTSHLATAHLYTSQVGGSEHFENWKAYLRQNSQKFYVATIDKLVPWSSLDITTLSAKRDFRCPSCPFSVAGVGGYGPDQPAKERAITEHHLSFLRPEAEVVKELCPHRMQILRLWPEFVTHPVFADFDQPKQQSSGGPPQVQLLFPEHVNNGFWFPDWTAHDFNQPEQQSESSSSQVHPSFASHINENFGTPDWTTYDFNTSM